MLREILERQRESIIERRTDLLTDIHARTSVQRRAKVFCLLSEREIKVNPL